MSAENNKESGRYHLQYNTQRDPRRDPKGKGKAVENLQSSLSSPSQREQRGVRDNDSDALYQYLLRDVREPTQPQLHHERRRAGPVEPNRGGESTRAKESWMPQDAMPERLPSPDTSMFQELAKLSPNPLMYMITSNLKRQARAEVHYWAALGDLLYKDVSCRRVAYVSMTEFLRRIHYELRIQNSQDDNICSNFTLCAQFGLDSKATIHPVAQKDRSISDVIQHYDAFLKSTDLPVYRQVLRFHLEFSSRPNGYPSARPSERITKHYLSLLKHPIVLNSDGTIVRRRQGIAPSYLSELEQRTSLKGSSSPRTTLSDFIPSPKPTQPIERPLSGLPDNKVPLRQFGKNLIPESLLKLDGIFHSDKQPSVLASLGPRMGVAGIYNLDGGLPDTQSPDVDEWRTCCSLLPDLDPYELSKDIQARSIPILRSTLRITPPQFYSAVEILRRPAGFLAHDMGIGKTHTVLAAVALRILILNSKRTCEQAWSSGSKGQHLSRNARPQQGQQCPSQIKRPGDVLCYCVPGGLTREIGRVTRGVCLIQVPVNARTEWINSIAQAKFSKASYDFVVVSQSSDVPVELKRSREFFKVFASTWKLSPMLKPGNQTAPHNLEATDFDWEIGAKFGHLESYVFITGHTDTTWYDMFKLSINGLPIKIYAAPVGLSFIDEAHNPNLWTSGSSASHAYSMARAHKAVANCANWFVSGTPLPQTPFESILSIAKPMNLIDPAKQAQIQELENSYQQLRSANNPDLKDHHLFIINLRGVFGHSTILRFRHSTKFLGQQISNITQSSPELVILKTTWRSKTQMQRLAARAEARIAPGYPPAQALEVNQGALVARDELYFVSLFPAAADMINDGTMNVDDRVIRKQIVKLEDRRQVASLPMVQDHLSRVIASGPKLKAILEEISRMNEADKLERPPSVKLARGKAQPSYRKESNRFRKMVIVTPNLTTAVFLFMYLKQPHFAVQYHPNPVLLHKDLPVATRSAIIMDFSKEIGGPRILVGPFDTIGTATNLQRANYQILTSPLPRIREVAQAFGRTNRTGQPLTVHHKILVLEDNPADAANLCMLAQCEIKSNIYNLSQKLEIQPM